MGRTVLEGIALTALFTAHEGARSDHSSEGVHRDYGGQGNALTALFTSHEGARCDHSSEGAHRDYGGQGSLPGPRARERVS